MVKRTDSAASIAYAAAWLLIAPLILVWWAHATVPVVALPVVHSPIVGAVLAVAGLSTMLAGILALLVYGGGLPINLNPPPHYVARGIYRWLSHPIYVGFVILSAGASLLYGSASGLWLVTPVTALVLSALVLGYERHDLRRRFGPLVRAPRLALPRAADGVANGWERGSIYVLVLLPWLIAYEAVQLLGIPPDAVSSQLPFERAWPVIEWTELPYASTYVLILLTPIVVRSRHALHRFALTGLIATAVVTLIYLTVPLISPPRPFTPTTLLGQLAALERVGSNTVAAFPAFHVIWPLIAAVAWQSRGRAWGVAALVWTAVIAVSCVTIGMHSLADVAFAVVVFLVVRRYDAIWLALRSGAETIANSWREWRIGPVRIINHGFYTGAGALIGFWLAGWLAGPELLRSLLFLSFSGLIASVLWAQFVEGSSALLRPLGYYGGILGGLIGMGVLALFHVNVVVLMGALAIAMPWIQAAGRLRCLVQGCCHGGPTTARAGIRYFHSRSRVTSIAGLAGVPIYPTPLYSIIANIVSGILLLRLWLLGASPALVLGLYFIFNAVARFVEESYRAEPQTPVVGRLHLYQWLAFGGLLVGIAFTSLNAPVALQRGSPLDPLLLTGATAVAVFTWFLTGVDFPMSDRRFSRLAPADSSPRLLTPDEVAPRAVTPSAVHS